MKRLLTGILWICVGCSASIDKDSNSGQTPAADAGGDDSHSSASVDGDLQAEDCERMLVWDGSDCILPERRISVRLTATSDVPFDVEPVICSDALVDADAARAFVDGDRVVEQTDDCIVTERLTEKNSWGYAPARTLFGDVEVSSPAGTLSLDSTDTWEGCRTAPDSADFFRFDESYDVDVSGGESSGPFSASIEIPADPNQNCPTAVPGEPLRLEWTSSGATSAAISLSRGDFSIRCRVDDDGELIIPGALTAHLPEAQSRYEFVDVRLQNVEGFLVEGTWTTAVGEAWNSCGSSE